MENLEIVPVYAVDWFSRVRTDWFKEIAAEKLRRERVASLSAYGSRRGLLLLLLRCLLRCQDSHPPSSRMFE